jgi:hypothetical protein
MAQTHNNAPMLRGISNNHYHRLANIIHSVILLSILIGIRNNGPSLVMLRFIALLMA